MELEQLKQIAEKVNFTYSHLLGAKKLESQLMDYCKEIGTTFEEVAKDLGIELPSIEGEPTEAVNTVSVPMDTVDKDFVKKLSKMTFAEGEAKAAKRTSAERMKEAMRLIRCTITCNNKNKTSYTGEIFSARNAVLPEVKKFVPFGTPTHVPQILLNMIKEKQYQMFRKEKSANGNMITKPHMIPEYNIQLLDPITKEEFNAIKQKQLAEGNGD